MNGLIGRGLMVESLEEADASLGGGLRCLSAFDGLLGRLMMSRMKAGARSKVLRSVRLELRSVVA